MPRGAQVNRGGPTSVHTPRRLPADDDATVHEATNGSSPQKPATVNLLVPRDPKQEKPKKDVRKAPEGEPLPAEGIFGAIYWASTKLGRPDKNYRRLTSLDRLLQEIYYREQWLLDLLNTPGLQLTISNVNTKGGAGKSIHSIYVGSIIANITRKEVYVVPATTNTKTAKVILVAGIKASQTLTMSQFAAKCGELPHYNQVENLLAKNGYGLRVLANDPDQKVGVDEQFALNEFRRVAQKVHENSAVRIFDHGNDNISDDSIGLEAARRSDILVLSASAKSLETLYGLNSTLSTYLSDTASPDLFQHGVPREVRIPTRYKAANGIVVMNRTEKGDDPEEFSRYCKRIDDQGNIIGDLGFTGTLHEVGEDPYIGDTSKDTIACDLSAIRLDTYNAFLAEANMIAVKVGRQRGLDLPRPNPVLDNLLRRKNMTVPDLSPVTPSLQR